MIGLGRWGWSEGWGRQYARFTWNLCSGVLTFHMGSFPPGFMFHVKPSDKVPRYDQSAREPAPPCTELFPVKPAEHINPKVGYEALTGSGDV